MIDLSFRLLVEIAKDEFHSIMRLLSKLNLAQYVEHIQIYGSNQMLNKIIGVLLSLWTVFWF